MRHSQYRVVSLTLIWMLPAVHWLHAGEVTESGAEAYYQWVSSCLDAIEKDLPAITASAEAAAAKYVKDDCELGICGDDGTVGEICGRSGGPMRMLNDNPGAALTISKREVKCVVLLILRDENFDRTMAKAGELRQHGNKVLIGLGRKELLEKVKAAGVVLDGAVENHAAPHGGLLQDERGAWRVPTDPVASMALGWTWIGEFVAACTRLGKMPPMYLGFAVPGGAERAKKIGNIKFHEGEPKPMPAGAIGKEYLGEQRKNLTAVHASEMERIRRVAEMALQARQAGKALYCVMHGHAVLGHVPYPPHDPGFLKRINKSWFTVDKNVQFAAGDVVFCVGFDGVFQGKEWGDFAVNARKAGAKLAWSLATYRAEDIKTIPADELLVDQHWAFGDAVATVDGYDVKILPTSGVQAEAVYWMVNAELLRISVGR